MRTLTNWLAAHRQRQRAELADHGYNFTAEALLRGASPALVKRLADTHGNEGGYMDGVYAALRDWERATAG